MARKKRTIIGWIFLLALFSLAGYGCWMLSQEKSVIDAAGKVKKTVKAIERSW